MNETMKQMKEIEEKKVDILQEFVQSNKELHKLIIDKILK